MLQEIVIEGYRSVNRGDIYYVRKYNTVGSEQKANKPRPAVIIQNNKGNDKSQTVIIAWLSKKLNKSLKATHYIVPNYKQHGLSEPSAVMLEQVTTVDKIRLVSFIGRMTAEDMREIDERLIVSLAIDISRLTANK